MRAYYLYYQVILLQCLVPIIKIIPSNNIQLELFKKIRYRANNLITN